jgi:3-hydroxyacyl-CoA dehydrogenase
MGLKYMPKPVVAAPFGYTLGGGCEVCLHADRICAAHETYIGLVETAIGVIPAGGGTKETLIRNLARIPGNLPPGIKVDPLPYIARALMTIIRPDLNVSTSGFAAKRIGHLHEDDTVVMNKSRLIAEAKAQVLALARNYQPPRPKKITLYGAGAYAALKAQIYLFKKGGSMTEHEVLIAEKLAEILTGGNLSRPAEVSEQYILDQERKVFIFLCRQEKTQERITHMLKTGKSLRN